MFAVYSNGIASWKELVSEYYFLCIGSNAPEMAPSIVPGRLDEMTMDHLTL